MTRTLFVAALAPALLLLPGCSEGLGKCEDPLQGRKPVVSSSGRVMYLGQAILLGSCATGCHSSGASGAARVGAPAGLDLDILPAMATKTREVTKDGETTTVAELDAATLSALRRRQRKVFDERHNIWDQVKDGLMPPGELGAGFRELSPGTDVDFADDGSCMRGMALPVFSSGQTQEALRDWLACGAPIVEANSAELPLPAAGSVGDQFPTCAADIGNAPPSIELVQENVFTPSCATIGCHSNNNPAADLNLSSAEAAYADLLGGDGEGKQDAQCTPTDKVLVTPGDADGSLLYEKVLAGADQDVATCGLAMPIGVPLSEDLLKLIRDWIEAGAPGPGEAASGDADAGM